MLVRALPFGLGIYLCAWYIHEGIASPTAKPIDGVWTACFVIVAVAIAACGITAVFKWPKTWRGYTWSELRSQRQIRRLAKSLSLLGTPNRHLVWVDKEYHRTLAIIYPERKQVRRALWSFLFHGFETYSDVSVSYGPSAGSSTQPGGRTYLLNPFGGASVTINGLEPVKPAAADYKWILDLFSRLPDPLPGL